jgi:hypothetical protein
MDISFYKYLYNDLSSLNNEELYNHYNLYGKNQNRIFSEIDYYNKYPNFNLDIYKKSNKDLQNLTNLELLKHYIYHGIYENRICSNLNTMNLSKQSGVSVKKIAIIFYGLTRSLHKTIHSIKKNLFNILDRHNIQYDIYIHTYKINGSYKNIWSGEETNNYNNEDINSLLNPKYLLFDNQSDIENIINFNEYYTFLNWNGFFPENLVRYMIKNLVLALYSKNKITKLFNDNTMNLSKQSGDKELFSGEQRSKENTLFSGEQRSKENTMNLSEYDYAIISRPDIEFTNEFNINYFNLLNNNNIIIPEQDSYEGCNDRFCIGKPSIILYYGTLYEKLLEYSKNKNIISECYLLDMLNIKNINIIKKNICYNTIRM